MRWLLVLFLLVTNMALAASNVVNVYNWGGYIPEKVLHEFTKQTGIKVNYTTYSSNAELYNKLKADPKAGYDVIVPSSYYVQRMAIEGMLHRLDKSKLSHFANLNPSLLNKAYDPHNHYSVPYLWGTTSILVNDKYYKPSSITSWNDLWQKRFHGQLLLINDVRDVFAMALRALGYSVNTRNPAQIRAAYLKLRALMPNLKLFTVAGEVPIYIDEDALVGMAQSGDAEEIIKANSHLHYIYPKGQAVIWIDCMVIPKYAPHLANAYRFINFILQAKIARQIALKLGYSTPNLAGYNLLPKAVQDNHTMYPSQATLRDGQVEGYLGSKALAIYFHYWELLKLSG